VKLVLIARDQRPGNLALERLQSGAKARGLHLEPELVVSGYAGHAVSVARERVSGADLLVAVGGDGTLHEVVNGAMSRLNETESTRIPRIGYVAAGTANDFARAIGEVSGEAQLLAALAADSWRDIDLGFLSLSGEDGETREAYFVNVADIGVGAEVVRRIAGSGRRLGATMTYFSAIVRVLAGYRRRPVRIQSDAGLDYDGPLLAAAFGNGKSFGAGLRILPDASVSDGELDCIVVGDVGLREFLGKFRQLKAGRHIDHPEVRYHRCRSLTVTADSKLGVEADGEFLGYLPATVRLLPGVLRMPLPQLADD
jgi:YegS/Rv2252/BmrU family lipid kinase